MEDPQNPYARREPAIDPSNPFASPLAEEVRDQRAGREGLLNPWISMWNQPRATIRQIIETDPRSQVLLLAALGSAGQLPQPASPVPVDADVAYLMGVVVGQAIMGAVIGIIALFLMGWLIKVVATWFGGTGTTVQTRAAFAWSCVPSVWFLPLIWVICVWWVMAPPNPAAGLGVMSVVLLLAKVVTFVLWIWELVLVSLAVAEVHRIHGGLGFAAVLLAGIMVFAGMMLLFLPLIFLVVWSAS